MRFFVTEQLGPKRFKTPEGFLVCVDVPLARVGEMLYARGEIPVTAGPDGMIRIERSEAEVFRPETIASGAGKPVVDNHPRTDRVFDVMPDNWRQVACGTAMHPHRGEGAEADLLLGDLFIADARMIDEIEAGKVEISLGYDAAYDEIAPGLGRQRNIFINHIALVRKGRCGPRCSIGDEANQETESEDMKTRDEAPKSLGAKVLDAIRDAFKTKDDAAFGKAMDAAAEAMGSEGTHVHIHGNEGEPKSYDEDIEALTKKHAELQAAHDALKTSHDDLSARLEALEKDDEDEDKDKTKDAAEPSEEEKKKTADAMLLDTPKGTTVDAIVKTADSSLIVDAFRETAALAEILSPGVKVPTFDAKDAPKKTFDSLCGFRRSVLDGAYKTADTRAMIDEVLAGREFDLPKMTCDAVRQTFFAAAALKKRANNSTGTRTQDTSRTVEKKGIRTLAELNARNREHYKTH